jgi:hypothetical protein
MMTRPEPSLVNLFSDILLERKQPNAEDHLVAHLRARLMEKNLDEPFRSGKAQLISDAINAHPANIPGMAHTALRHSGRARRDSKH